MIAYADTSWWLAYKCPGDAHHLKALRVFDDSQLRIIWTPWQRVEVFNSLRQAERAGVIAPGKAAEFIRTLEQEIRLGYWLHAEFSWTGAVRRAVAISEEFALALPIRGMDLFHVAIAAVLKCDAFLSFDEDQLALATAARLQTPGFDARSS